MPKDPAFLFYPSDWLGGTMHLDFECKGAYIDLMMLQFQKGHMTLHMIQHILGHKFQHIWPQISDKFKECDGKYWNERLKEEQEKRANYCKSRRENKISKKDMFLHMSQHMENENEDISINQLNSENARPKKFINYRTQGDDLYAARLKRGEDQKNANRG